MMSITRRTTLGMIAGTLVPLTPASAAGFDLASWIKLGEIVADAADGLDHVTEVLGNISLRAIHGAHYVAAQRAASRLTTLTASMSDLYINQVGMTTTIDRYGDDWRQATDHGLRPLTKVQKGRLESEWQSVLKSISAILSGIRETLDLLKQARSDLVLQPAYIQLGEALNGKAGVLATLSRSPAPLNSDELDALVDSEENFLRLRAEFHSAIKALNDYISQTSS